MFRDSFNSTLESHDLIYHYDLPTSTPVTSLIERVANDMQASAAGYQFSSNNSRASFLSHEVLPLQLLSIVNRGIPRPNDHQIRLRRTGHSEDQTIANLAFNRTLYAIPSIAFEGNRFVIHLSK